MAVKNRATLLSQAETIRDEVVANANTATRVGGHEVDVVDSFILTSEANANYLQNVVEDTTPELGGNLDGGANDITNVTNFQFAGGAGSEGTLSWNTDEETLDLVQSGATLQLGQEIHYHARNNSGVAIADGEAVMATGTLGASGRITIAAMNNDGSIEPEYFMGIATEAIANGTDGKVTDFGKIRGIQTNGANYGEVWNDGDLIYLDTVTPGALTNVQPTASAYKVAIAIVVNAHASNGTLFVRVTGNEGIHDLHDVQVTSITDNDILRYNASNSRWENEAIPEEIMISCSDLTTDLAVDTSVSYIRMPFAMTLTGVRASVLTAPTGATLTVDINESGSSILSTKLTIDISEKTSTTAATPPVISDSSLADDAEITIDIDQVGSTIAGAGLIVTLIGTRT